MNLDISHDLSLPLDVASQAVAVLGIRGSGKTNSATVIAEELLAKGQPMVYIDPTDAAWGLRSDFPVFIFGGTHGDLPLQETDGKTLAEFVVTEHVPVILSLRHLRKNAQRRFVTDFCEEIYHLKGRPENRTPLTVFIDEAPLFVPQKVMGDNARTVGAVEDMIARGRNAGFGVVLISQRSATINKDVLTQCDTIITHRLTSPQDRKALSDWIEENATIEKRKEVLQSLATMPNGRAWVWSPRLDVMKQVQIRLRKTFDSSATPKRGETPPAPKRLEEVDLGKLKAKLATAVAEAQANDPKHLRMENADLRAQCAKFEREAHNAGVATIDPAEVDAAHRRGKIEGYAEAIGALQPMVDRMQTLRTALDEQLGDLIDDLAKWKARHSAANIISDDSTVARHFTSGASIQIEKRKSPEAVKHSDQYAGKRKLRLSAPTGNGDAHQTEVGLGGGAPMRVLAVLKQFPGAPARRVGALAGISTKLSTFRLAIAKLRQQGFIEGDRDGFTLTVDGRAAAANVPPIPTGPEAIEHWRRELGNGAPGRIFDALLLAYPENLSASELHRDTGIDPSLSTFRLAVARLRHLELVDGNRSGMRASAELFE